jgi:hypothetical protein
VTRLSQLTPENLLTFIVHIQGWVTDDHTILLLDDEKDELNAPSGSQY